MRKDDIGPEDDDLRRRLVAYQTQHKPKNPDMVPSEQHLHGKPVAGSDPSDQDFV